MVTCQLLFAQKYQLGFAVTVLNMYTIHSESHDLQSMYERYIEPNKYWCEIIGPQNSTLTYILTLDGIIGDH